MSSVSTLKLALLPQRESATEIIERLENRVYELEEQLGARTEFLPALNLTPSETALLGLLLKREIMSQEAACTILYGSDRDGGPAGPKQVVSVLIMNLRKKVASEGIQIQTRNGVGYFLTRDAKARLREMIRSSNE